MFPPFSCIRFFAPLRSFRIVPSMHANLSLSATVRCQPDGMRHQQYDWGLQEITPTFDVKIYDEALRDEA